MESRQHTQVDDTIINCIRFLAVDAVEKANSGHPGMPMGAAPMAYTLWKRFLKINPQAPLWPDRDRFVLSAGHGSMLLYALLHISGFDLSLDDIKNFRQWGSKTPGHPEYGETPGIETTTGPLGQGFANGVGMAIAERSLAARFNKPDCEIVNHFTYVISGDGCMMEGISQEAASLAGHLGLGRLIVLYDDNHITIDGSTDLAFSENVLDRFKAYGWDTHFVPDGNDCDAIAGAIATAREIESAPSIIAVRTHIAFGSPNKQDSSSAHGSPLGADEVKLTKAALHWPDKSFYIPQEVHEYTKMATEKGTANHEEWLARLGEYTSMYPAEAQAFRDVMESRLPADWESHLPRFENAMATRSASGKIINAIAEAIPQLMGGSADLTPSNNTMISSSDSFTRDSHGGRYFHFGVREHAMGAVVNGLTLHRGVIPYCGTFLVFSDYMRPAIRLAALMQIPTIYIFTHDSVGLGEDGPTHQPVEHLAALRAIPGLTVIRPGDANETVGGWRFALGSATGPVALILTRQSLPPIEMPADDIIDGVSKGAYIVYGSIAEKPDAIIVATGSEVSIAIEAAKEMKTAGKIIRVVSMPSWEIFEQQDDGYKAQMLPPGVPCLSVEAQITFGWDRWSDHHIGIDRFGASAPGDIVMEKLGISTAHIVKKIKAIIGS